MTTDELAAATAAALAEWDALPLGATKSATPVGTGDYAKTVRRRHALVPLLERFAAAKEVAGAGRLRRSDDARGPARGPPEVAAVERERYAAVLLDEYQDTGHAQIEILASLFGGGHPVTAVGDPFQSIYGWRGAAAGNIGRFATTFRAADGTPAATFPLATSWRNERAHPGGRQRDRCAAGRDAGAGVQLRPDPAAPAGRVRAVIADTVEDEAAWLADTLGLEWHARRRETGRRRCWSAGAAKSRRCARRCWTPGCRSRWSASAVC